MRIQIGQLDMAYDGLRSPDRRSCMRVRACVLHSASLSACHTPQSLGDISRLPSPLLASVLQHVPLGHRHTSCALVNRAWSTAAAAGQEEINIKQCSRANTTSCSKWLCKHPTQVTSIKISIKPLEALSMPQYVSAQLLLPVHQLSSLRQLDLTELTVVAVRGNGQAIASTWLTALSGLPSLKLFGGRINLQGLSALTALKHLDIRRAHGYLVSDDNNAAALAEAVPRLLQLTALTAEHNAVLTHTSRLTNLQLLKVESRCSADSFMQFPVSLTHLEISLYTGPNDAAALLISPSSTPGLSRLTNLQALRVNGVRSFDIAILTALTALRKLEIHRTRITAGPGAPKLGSMLYPMTNLQHLQLAVFDAEQPPAVTAADYSAITSQHLTHLDLSGPTAEWSSLGPEFCYRLFSAQRQLPNLQSLSLGAVWFCSSFTVQHIVRCCPNLRELAVKSTFPGGPIVAATEPDEWAESVSCLTALRGLTQLRMEVDDVDTSKMWPELASLTGLRSLSMNAVQALQLGDIMKLTACRQLTSLFIETVHELQDMPGFNAMSLIHVDNKVRLLPRWRSSRLLPQQDRRRLGEAAVT